MNPMSAYAMGLATALLFVFVAARLTQARWGDPLPRTALAILGNWIAGLVMSIPGGITDAWAWNIAIDGFAAFVILWRPAGRWQSLLGVSYCAQIAMHIGYGALLLTDQQPDQWSYYDALTRVAWVQLALLGAWGGRTIWRALAGHNGGGSAAGAAGAGVRNMDAS